MVREAIRSLTVQTYSVPTDAPEADGTLEWKHTELVLVEVHAGDHVGTGYTYAQGAVAELIRGVLAPLVVGGDCLSPSAAYVAMGRALRNLGRRGLGWMALSAVDTALWDLKARVLDISLSQLIGQVRDSVPIYGSGGFTSYSASQLMQQLKGWVEEGIPSVKMKVGTHPDQDAARVQEARNAIGPVAGLFVDANGAYSRKQALGMARDFAALGVTWFEEPVSSDDLVGLGVVRDALPPGMELAAGEYGSDLESFRGLLGTVDVLQADLTRCGGVTGLLEVATLAEANHLPLSLHCAPALHAKVALALRPLRHLEFFHDHVRIERMAFEGFPALVEGALRPDATRTGHGLTFRTEAMAGFERETPAHGRGTAACPWPIRSLAASACWSSCRGG